MTPTTRAQREALYALFCRSYPVEAFNIETRRLLYRGFRGHFRCQGTEAGGYLGGYNIAETWPKWYGIEPDGHIS